MPVRPYCCAAILLTVTAMVFVAPVIAADSSNPGDGRSASAIALDERVVAGDLKYRDSTTGEVVVATAERIAALRSGFERHFGQPPVYNRSVSEDGTVSSEIGDAIRDVIVVRTNLDGTRETACFRTVDAAVAFIVGLDRAGTKNGEGDRQAAVR
jgi:hypothetical protein